MAGVNKPNIIYIMADDLGYGDFGCYGSTKIPTPNVDRLASEGIRFTDAHSSSAVCSPSRYSVLTGRYCWRTWLEKWVLMDFGTPLIEKERETIASLLKKQGYTTAAIGKWHVGLGWQLKSGKTPSQQKNFPYDEIDFSKPLLDSPLDHGFDYSFIISGSLDMGPYCFIENNRTVGIPNKIKAIRYNQQRKNLQVEDWDDSKVDTTFTAKSIEFIKKCNKENPEKPFFLYLTTACPHRPCDIPVDFVRGKSQAGDRGDMVVLFDWIVGQILNTLDECGIGENTLLMISSDNGARATCANGKDYGHKSNGNLRGQKADIWEGGHREPLIARWPNKIKPGTTSDSLVCLSDLFATFADLTGAEIPHNAAEDSFSFLDSLLNKETPIQETKPIRTSIIHHSGNGMFSYRVGKMKMIRGLGSGGFTKQSLKEKVRNLLNLDGDGQLYNLEDDLLERKNLWKKQPEIVRQMLDDLKMLIDRGRTRLE